MNNINGFTFFRSYHDSLSELDRESKRDILEAIDDFMFEDKEPELEGFMKSIWSLIRPNLISSKNHSRLYQEKPKKKSKKIKSKSNENQNDDSDILEDKNKNKNKNKKLDKKRKEQEKEEGDVSTTTNNNIYSFLEKSFGRTISFLEREILDTWLGEFNEDIVKHAIEIAVLNNTKKVNYIEGILRNWKACGYKSLDEILEYEDDVYTSRSENNAITDFSDFNWLDDDE